MVHMVHSVSILPRNTLVTPHDGRKLNHHSWNRESAARKRLRILGLGFGVCASGPWSIRTPQTKGIYVSPIWGYLGP